MKTWANIAAGVVLAGVGSIGAASAADLATMPVKAVVVEPPPPMFDVAFGVKFTSDYIFRGVTQTDGNAAVQGYAELRAFDWVYLGIAGSNVDFPASAGLSDPSAEIDFYGGLRHTWGGFTGDVGFIYYYYTGQANNGTYGGGFPTNQLDFWEVYFKPTYVVNDMFTVGGNLFYTDSFAGSGASGTYLSGTVKVALPNYTSNKDWGWYLSGELGYQWLGDTDLPTQAILAGVTNYALVDYATWNVGVGFTYKAMTIDLRYYDTDLNRDQCYTNTALYNGCGDRYVASISFDTTLLSLK
ncbi:TorF family putative porin [Xanthobacteraceae bacterium A53D]